MKTLRHVPQTVLKLALAALSILMVLPLSAMPAAARGTAMSPSQVREVMELDAPIQPGEYAWDERDAPPGPVKIVVDLAKQKLYVYRGGVEIGRTFILYGVDEKPTPTGVFPILQKDADHHSSSYHNAPMPYTLRLTWGGVAIHGSVMDPRYGTHGCIGVPTPFAKILFKAARLGDVVLVTRHWMPAVYGKS